MVLGKCAILVVIFGYAAMAKAASPLGIGAGVRNIYEASKIRDNMVTPVNEMDLADDGIDTWEPPYNFSSRFPYILSGHDYDSRPIWIFQFGHWNLKSVVDGGPQEMKAFEMYAKQLAYRVLKSTKTSETEDCVVLLDYEGLKIAQVASLPTMQFLLKLSRNYMDVVERHMGAIYIVNANFVAETLINLTRPIFGKLDDRLEVHGANKSRWMPLLSQKLPVDQIPYAYGGRRTSKPLKVFG